MGSEPLSRGHSRPVNSVLPRMLMMVARMASMFFMRFILRVQKHCQGVNIDLCNLATRLDLATWLDHQAIDLETRPGSILATRFMPGTYLANRPGNRSGIPVSHTAQGRGFSSPLVAHLIFTCLPTQPCNFQPITQPMIVPRMNMA